MTSWHTQTAQSVLSQLNTSEKGLQADEVRRRGAQYGPNTLHVTPPPSWLIILIAQFRSVVVLLLFVAALAAWVLSDPLDAIAIAGVLVINTAIGFITELRARRAMEALRRLEVPRTTVMRDGRKIEINARELVPGDVVILEGGQSVPADARLTSATDLRVNEAPLTGESMPVEKRHDVVLDEQTVLAERSNMLYQATSLLSGAARAVVTATGSQTELGRIGAMTSALGEESTPLERRLDALGRRLVWVALGVALLVAAIGLLRGEAWSLVIQTAIALAIAAVPEGLPAVATITLAVGVWRMARRKALVRRLPVVETLGSATVVCADKTGTLTAGQMAVTTIVTADAVYAVSGGTYAPEGQFSRDDQLFNPLHDAVLAEALHVGALANHAEVLREDGTWRAVGDPTEAALLVAASKAGLDRETMRRQMPEAGEVPFSSERQWMATFHRTSDGLRAYVKGAPGRLIERSSADDVVRDYWLARNRELSGRGLRVLALAHASAGEASEASIRDLKVLALVGIADPPADGVPETIKHLRTAGIRTVMITGDQRLTAEAVARQLGLIEEGEGAIDGRELSTLDQAALAARLKHTGVFNRVSPADKLRIVEALQAQGEIVAMLGDGVNDAAALKKADIGVTMGQRGTDIAKDAADVVLQDDRFPTIAAAVEEGRVIFDNIRKFVFYLFSCNLAEVLVLLIAGIAALPQPLLPLQILWLNVVTDTFPALALAIEPSEPQVMQRPPRDPQSAILSRSFLVSISFYASLIAAVTLVAFVASLDAGAQYARTMAFVTLALAQGLHLGNARSTNAVLAWQRMFANRWAIAALLLVIALQVVALYLPALARVLRVMPLHSADWVLAFTLAAVPAVIGQIIKLLRKDRRPRM